MAPTPGSSPPTSATLRLKIAAAGQSELVGKELLLDQDRILLGRSPECDLVLSSNSVSRRHAEIVRDPDGFLIRDLGSANGLRVQGQRVDEIRLRPGVEFAVGDVLIRVESSILGSKVPDRSGFFSVERTAVIANLSELVREMERPQPLEELGERVVAAANKPFLLDDPEVVWLVESGKLELFAVQVEKGEPVGARQHFLTVEAGEAAFGMDTARYGMGSGFLVVGKAGSVLRRFDVAKLMDLASVPAHAERIGKLLAVWIGGLSRRLTSDLPSIPRADLRLPPGEKIQWRVGEKLNSGQGVVWLELPAERLLFAGMASLGRDLEGVFFPLGPGCWLELLSGEGELTIHGRSSSSVAGDPRTWAGLDVFHRILCECEFVNKRLAFVDEFQRLRKKAEHAAAAEEQGYAAIGSVLGGTGVWIRPTALGVDSGPILQACQAIGAMMGFEVRPHPAVRDDQTFEDALAGIAAASRFRTRKIALVDDWWNYDQGPMLAQRGASKTPVAILPKKVGLYELFDPKTGERIEVDSEVARELQPFAWVLYRPFPPGPLKAMDLVRFGLRGLKSEVQTVAVTGILVGLLGTLTPLVSGKVFDVAIPQAERGLLWQFTLGLALAAFCSAAFKITQNVALLRVQGNMDYAIQAAVWDRLIDLPMDFFRRFNSGDLADRAAGVDQIRSIISGAGVAAILGSFSSLFNAVQMVTYSGALALTAIGLTLVYVLVSWIVNFLQLKYQRQEFALRGKLSGLVLQLISGVAKLRVAGAEGHAFRMWATRFAEQRRVSFRSGSIQNVHQVFSAGFPVFSNMAIFFVMYLLRQEAIEKGERFDMTTGDFLAFSAAFGIFTSAMQALGDASLSMLRVVPVFERLRPILETEPEVDPTKSYPGELRGEIELSHLWFRYSEDSPWIIRDLSLKIQPGQMVAFVGGSGCGKSTLLRLMLGFERPQKGSVYYDGQDLATLDLRMVRQQLGVVLQDSRLLPADIFRNIVGTSSRTLEDAWAAAQKASIADDIRAMPMGMHTVVSEGGGAFSGGQKQRLMIARALVNNPKIIFLDEATSALDNRAQAIVTESMNRLQATRIVIAHRLSTIVDADVICYLENGQIVEQGTYEELMAKNGKFAALARRQLA